jgi:hypothetical protein
MPSADRRYQRARRRAKRILDELAREIHDARLAAGTNQLAVGRVARISRSKDSRIESSLLPNLSILDAVAVADAVGLDLSVKTFPGRMNDFPEYITELPRLALKDVVDALERGVRPETGYALI